MTKEEAIDIIRDTYHTETELEALKVLLPELQESEDERIRKELIGLISCMHDADTRKKRWITWLEKQKEQPKEELVYRMNGLMQEYVKEGEDDAEKEHRLKCYQLFWDALEDADFFEQKEQKPITINQDEKEFLANEITAFLCNYDKEFDGEDPVPSEIAEHFYLLGKKQHEQKPNYCHYGGDPSVERCKYCSATCSTRITEEQKPVDFPTTDEEVNEFLETHPKVEVPEKYKTPDFVFSKQEWSEEIGKTNKL